MTKSSIDRKRSKYGKKYTLRFHKRLKIYELTCIDETPHLIAKFVETDGDLAMRLWGRLESNYKYNKQLKQELKIYHKIANCKNCEHHDYDWFKNGDEFEVCEKGNDITKGICEEWREL